MHGWKWHQLIGRFWVRVAIFGTHLIQVSELHAYPPFAIGLLDHYDIGQPSMVFDGSDEADLSELSHIFLDCR